MTLAVLISGGYREQAGLVGLSVTPRLSPRTIGRLYSFQDLLELLAGAPGSPPGPIRMHIGRCTALAELYSTKVQQPAWIPGD